MVDMLVLSPAPEQKVSTELEVYFAYHLRFKPALEELEPQQIRIHKTITTPMIKRPKTEQREKEFCSILSPS